MYNIEASLGYKMGVYISSVPKTTKKCLKTYDSHEYPLSLIRCMSCLLSDLCTLLECYSPRNVTTYP